MVKQLVGILIMSMTRTQNSSEISISPNAQVSPTRKVDGVSKAMRTCTISICCSGNPPNVAKINRNKTEIIVVKSLIELKLSMTR